MKSHVICLVVAAFGLASVSAQTTFLKLADTTTAIPGGTGVFSDLRAPVAGINSAAFQGIGAGGQQGYYLFDGSVLTKLVDTNTLAPSGTGKLTNFSSFAYGLESNFVFAGTDGGGMNGMFNVSGGVTSMLGNTNTAAPGSSGNFVSYFAPALSGAKIAFLANAPNSYRAAYILSAGTFTKVLDNQTTFPGGTGNLNFSSQLAYDGTNIAVWASDTGLSTRNGIFTHNGTSLVSLAVTNDPIPGVANRFSSFQSPPCLSAGVVVFQAQDANSVPAVRGIFSAPVTGGALSSLVTTATPIPGGTNGNFSSFNGFSYDKGVLIFVASGTNGQPGLFKLAGGTLTAMLAPGAPLDGKAVSTINLNPAGFKHNIISFLASFSDASKGVFGADLGSGASPDAVLGFGGFSPSNGPTLTFAGEPNRAYRIQHSSTMQPGSWITVTNFTYTAPFNFLDGTAVGQSRRFYRAISP
jgi:hypothetical protein